MAESIESYLKYVLTFSDSVSHEFQIDTEYNDTKEIQLRISLLRHVDAMQSVALRKLYAKDS